jgi:lipid-A-disaccharide synthase-like uncharacterized protein
MFILIVCGWIIIGITLMIYFSLKISDQISLSDLVFCIWTGSIMGPFVIIPYLLTKTDVIIYNKKNKNND